MSNSTPSDPRQGLGRLATHVSDQRQVPHPIAKIPKILPHERVFPIQIGSELFKLSGASLSSDAPSYFSRYFQSQIKRAEEAGEDIATAIRTLYIDRDPDTFKDISLHLQGYHLQPRDGTHFVRLFADAQFYTLPKLLSQLYEESIFMSIGHREFQIPRDIFQAPGNSPNFFSLGFSHFFSSPDEVFPGLDRNGLLRPPSILPPSVPHKSADIFADLLHLLRGYPLRIRDEEHRASLLRDCRYFNFKGLEQTLIPHRVSFNQARRRHEIALRVEEILKSGISVAFDGGGTPSSSADPDQNPAPPPPSGWVHYARPFTDDHPHELVLEIGGENMRLHANGMRAEFFGQVGARVARMFEIVASKLPLSNNNNNNNANAVHPLGLLARGRGGSIAGQSQMPTAAPASGGRTGENNTVRVVFDPDSHITLDGRPYRARQVEHDEMMQLQLQQQLQQQQQQQQSASAVPNTFSSPSSMVPSIGEGLDVSPTTTNPSMMGASTGFFGVGLQQQQLQQQQQQQQQQNPRKRRRTDGSIVAMPGSSGGALPPPPPTEDWIVRRGQWRLRIRGARVRGGPPGVGGGGGVGVGVGARSFVECVFVAVKVEAYTAERARNEERGFLV